MFIITTMLAIDSLTLTLYQQPLLGPLTLNIAPGEIVTLMGPSGCGKSSLLAALTGTLTAPLQAAGRVSLDGRVLDELPPEQRRIGLILQQPLLFPHMSVAHNLAFALPPGLPKTVRQLQVEAALSEAQLDGFGPRDPATLSGGQASRVALWRTLLAQPQALLLDEPFGGLDSALRADTRRYVYAHIRARRIPALLVTHDCDDLPDGGRLLTIDQHGGIHAG